MAGNTVSQFGACIQLTTRAEQPESVLSADAGLDAAWRQVSTLADHGADVRDRAVGVGERALRRLRDDGVI